MKNKFVLTEDESKRILSLHKEKIDKERNVVLEQQVNPNSSMGQYLKTETDKIVKKTKKNGYLTLPKDVAFENSKGAGFSDELKLFKGTIFKIQQSGTLVSNTAYEKVASFVGKTNEGARKGTVYYNCERGKFKVKNAGTDTYFNEDNPIEMAGFKQLCNMSRGSAGSTTPPPVPSKQGCPKIIKSFTDAGFIQITVERYRELANDTTRVRKYKFCPVTKKNLFFAKPKQGTGGGGGGDNSGGGGGGGTRYSFDYNQILTAINQKCPGGGGGTTPDDQDIVNPFGQGGEQGQPQPQVIKVTDEIYAGLK